MWTEVAKRAVEELGTAKQQLGTAKQQLAALTDTSPAQNVLVVDALTVAQEEDDSEEETDCPALEAASAEAVKARRTHRRRDRIEADRALGRWRLHHVPGLHKFIFILTQTPVDRN